MSTLEEEKSHVVLLFAQLPFPLLVTFILFYLHAIRIFNIYNGLKYFSGTFVRKFIRIKVVAEIVREVFEKLFKKNLLIWTQ